ncbi:hypothetical protein ACFPMF_20100 [Larkinella bovis]|uniref:Uncharacterized protein n=1 Tax=Larkinella bovis TaxID=683041 RepID=A0ABW0IGG2_9BACT
MKIKEIAEAIENSLEALKGEKAIDKKFSSQKTLPDEASARQVFAQARERLFDVDRWSDISNFTASFFLHNVQGNPKPAGRPERGDYIKIELPGPTPVNWVTVVEIVDDAKKVSFTARPCPDPHGSGGQTDHFLQDSSTSTFQVEWRGHTVKASQIGRNEMANNQKPEAGDRALINTVVAGGGWLFYQKIQWKSLTAYLVNG